jgi:predicted transcriptional regulator of viral defense system
MEGQRVQDWADLWIAELATRQHGVVAWFQLRDAGIRRALVDFRLAQGRLHIVHRGVYAVGHRALTPEGRMLAAVLAYGPTAVLSHRPAAEHWGLLLGVSSAVHVTVPGRGTLMRRRGIVVHRTPDVDAETLRAVPVTTVPRTLLDLAATAGRRTLDRAIERAETLRLFDLAALEPMLAERRPGVAVLRAALAVYDDAPTRSELERRFLELCDEHDLPRPLVNTRVGGYEVDFLWPEQRVIVETDGLEWHSARGARARDHERDAALVLAGYRPHHVNWRQVVHQPATLAGLVRRLLGEP